MEEVLIVDSRWQHAGEPCLHGGSAAAVGDAPQQAAN